MESDEIPVNCELMDNSPPYATSMRAFMQTEHNIDEDLTKWSGLALTYAPTNKLQSFLAAADKAWITAILAAPLAYVHPRTTCADPLWGGTTYSAPPINPYWPMMDEFETIMYWEDPSDPSLTATWCYLKARQYWIQLYHVILESLMRGGSRPFCPISGTPHGDQTSAQSSAPITGIPDGERGDEIIYQSIVDCGSPVAPIKAQSHRPVFSMWSVADAHPVPTMSPRENCTRLLAALALEMQIYDPTIPNIIKFHIPFPQPYSATMLLHHQPHLLDATSTPQDIEQHPVPSTDKESR